MNPLSRVRLRLLRTARITGIWVLVSLLAALFEHNVLAEAGVPVSLRQRIDAHVLIGFFAGLLGGGTYIFLLRDRLRKFAFFPAWGIVAVLLIPVVALFSAWMPTRFDHALAVERLFTLHWLGHYLYWTLLMGGTMLMVRLNDQYGGGGIGYLTGQYRRPRQEMRIFMFLDMRSSTSIAEQLGHQQYFKLINELYVEITDPILYSRGEIYQYIGDEISVSWPLRKGVRKQRCVRCFLDIRAKLQQRAAHYKANYGIEPVFKAGFHYGPVTTGEVGSVKRERIFSGDVVNTAARIQNTCNDHGVDNLLSDELLQVLRLPANYQVREIGSIELKGKKQPTRLWTIDQVTDVRRR